jgi:hypothetical protein
MFEREKFPKNQFQSKGESNARYATRKGYRAHSHAGFLGTSLGSSGLESATGKQAPTRVQNYGTPRVCSDLRWDSVRHDLRLCLKQTVSARREHPKRGGAEIQSSEFGSDSKCV